MERLGILLAVLLAAAGCLGPAASPSATEASPSSVNGTETTEAWTWQANVSLGWTAAVGEHTFVGDTIVGVRSHDQCPSASFASPESAANVSIEFTPSIVGPGAGTYTVAISRPGAITYLSPPASASSFATEDPAAGVWTIELKPRGAAVNQVWPFVVTVDGDGEVPGSLGLVKDGDCLL